MRIRSSSDLRIRHSNNPLPSIEIDLDSLPDDCSFPSVLSEAMAERALLEEDDVAVTAYTYFGPSVNFGTPTSSAFVVFVGRPELLETVDSVFRRLPGARVRFSDYLQPSQCRPQAHIEGGTLWRPLDADNWYADVEMLIPEDDGYEDDCQDDEPGEDLDDADVFAPDAPTRTSSALRVRAARSDASVGSIIRTIERIFALPEGSVALCGPDKRALRRDARIATLRRRWE